MTVTHTFVATRSHKRFQITARLAASGIFPSSAEFVVEDTESRASIKLRRPELMPLLGAIKEALKEVDDAAAGLPGDPVERAAIRVPHSGLATTLHRVHILKAYRQEMAELQVRFVRRFEDEADRIRAATDPKVPAPTRD